MNGQSEKLANLPDFDRPPAIETLIGVYFRPLENWRTQYFGLFWQAIKNDYPDVQVHPPLNSEQGLKLELTPERAQIRISGEVAVRWWYFHKTGKRLVQIQSDSFIQNWRKRDSGDPYLHYGELRPSFVRLWQRFEQFLKDRGISQPIVETCEVTYVNHIDKGSGWNHISELGEVVRCWSGQTTAGWLPSPTSVSFDSIYPIGERAGQLRVALSPGVREQDKAQTLQLVLTARSKPRSSELSELLDCLDLNRAWVVNGFADITTDKMHTIWGKKERKLRRSQ